MAQAKYWRRDEKQPLSKIEEQVGHVLIEVENSSTELKNELKDFYLVSVKEFEVTRGTRKAKNALFIQVPFGCLRTLQKVHRKVVLELEKRLKCPVMISGKRTIQSKWVKTHKSQKRPSSRTLTAVHDAILDDLCLPSAIIGKRIRVRIDGSRVYKIFLDQKDKDALEDKIDAIATIYKQITTKDVTFEFR